MLIGIGRRVASPPSYIVLPDYRVRIAPPKDGFFVISTYSSDVNLIFKHGGVLPDPK